MDNYEILQRISSLVSEQIQLEQFYRLGVVDAYGEQVAIPADVVTRLKRRFAAARTELINLENQIVP